jgi:hypothetical protein
MAAKTDTAGNAPLATHALFSGKVHVIKNWRQHPYRRDMVIPTLFCGTRSNRQFPGPITAAGMNELLTKDLYDPCQRCAAKL